MRVQILHHFYINFIYIKTVWLKRSDIRKFKFMCIFFINKNKKGQYLFLLSMPIRGISTMDIGHSVGQLFYRIAKFFNAKNMNGIIFQDSKVYVGCSAKFLFKPNINERSVPAIAEFYGGEKAYAEIKELGGTQMILRIGEYLTADGARIPEKVWRLNYDKNSDTWSIVEKIKPNDAKYKPSI